MTPYYADDKYYRRWCCLCIKCCEKEARESKEIFYDAPEVKKSDRDLEPTETTQTEKQTEKQIETGTQTLPVTDTTTKSSLQSGLSSRTQLADNLSTNVSSNVSSIDTMNQLKISTNNNTYKQN